MRIWGWFTLPLVCLLVGHEGMIERKPGRVRLRCRRCRRVSPGWDLRAPAPVATRARRAAAVRRPVVIAATSVDYYESSALLVEHVIESDTTDERLAVAVAIGIDPAPIMDRARLRFRN